MPQPIFHLYLAERPAIADALPGMAGEVRNAFLHGALAPDVGFFPGGDRRLSELVHHSRTADMCRALLNSAMSPSERAFAWGWLSHVLADVLLHPVINEWCGRQLGDGASKDDLLRLHVQLELGMDVLHVAAVKREGIPSFESTFEKTSVGFLTHVYQRVYGVGVAPAEMLEQQCNVERLTKQLLELELILAGAAQEGLATVPHKLVLQALRTAAAVSRGSRSIVTAFLHPVYPDLELGLNLKSRLDLFDRWFYRCVATDLRELHNLDLDTGLPISEETGSAVA